MKAANRAASVRRTGSLALVALAVFGCSSSRADNYEDEACKILEASKAFSQQSPNSLYYYATDRILRQANSGDRIPKNVRRFIFVTGTEEGQEGLGGVVNWKFVYTTAVQPTRRNLVDLNNDRWGTGKRLQQAKDACSNVSVDGYDNFHMYGTSNICLRYYFHQQDPDTLATTAVRQSFAFVDMVPETQSYSLSSIFIKPAKAAEQSETSAVRKTAVMSWIKNFVYRGKFSCIAVNPEMPQNAVSLWLRTTNLGTKLSPYPSDWKLTISE